MSYEEKIQQYVDKILSKARDNVIPLSCAKSAINYIEKVKKCKNNNEEVHNV